MGNVLPQNFKGQNNIYRLISRVLERGPNLNSCLLTLSCNLENLELCKNVKSHGNTKTIQFKTFSTNLKYPLTQPSYLGLYVSTLCESPEI